MERHKNDSCYIIYVSVIVLNSLDRKKRKTISEKYVINVRINKKWNNVKKCEKSNKCTWFVFDKKGAKR